MCARVRSLVYLLLQLNPEMQSLSVSILFWTINGLLTAADKCGVQHSTQCQDNESSAGTGRVQVWTLCWPMFMCPRYLQRHTDNAPAAESTSNLICFNIGFIINSVMGTSKSQHATGLKQHIGWATIYVSTPCRNVCHLDLMTM